MLAPSRGASWTALYRFIVSRSDSAYGRGELSVGRSADPRPIAEARNRHFGTHGFAVSAWPPANTVTFLAHILREPVLRTLMIRYGSYYEKARTHLALDKDAPIPRPVMPPGEGDIVAIPEVGGLHHRYERRAA